MLSSSSGPAAVASDSTTTATTSSSLDDTKDRREVMLVSSWVRNEEQCVTLARVASELRTSRPRARELLEREAAGALTVDREGDESDDRGTQLRATWCEVATATVPANPSTKDKNQGNDDIPCTVFRLVTGDVGDFQKANEDRPNERTICALSLGASTESVDVAHERDLARCRDALASNPRALLAVAAPAADATPPAIQLGPEMQALWNASLEYSASDAATATEMMPSSSAAAAGLRTKTTAASFFASGKPKSGGGATTGSTLKSSGAAKSSSSSQSARQPSTSTGTKSPREDEKENKESGIPQKAEKDVPTKKPAVAASAKSGPRSAAAAKPAGGKVGTADDFVGDMDTDSDDDEDDDVVMNLRDDEDDGIGESEDDESPSPGGGTPVRKPSRSKPSRSRNSDDDEVDDAKDHSQAKESAKPRPMDDFVASHAGGKPATRRRKRVVEKTFKDEHGYLQTELQEIWEDVPVEESHAATSTTSGKVAAPPSSHQPSAPAKPAAKKSTTGKSSMKQGNLMGFFAKK